MPGFPAINAKAVHLVEGTAYGLAQVSLYVAIFPHITSLPEAWMGPRSLWQGASGLPRRMGSGTSVRASSRVGLGRRPVVVAEHWGVVVGPVGAGLGSQA